MDDNEITFDAILKNSAFKRCQSPKNMRAAEVFEMFLDENFSNREMREKVDHAVTEYVTDSEDAAFAQGFSFAVKLLKFIDRAG